MRDIKLTDYFKDLYYGWLFSFAFYFLFKCWGMCTCTRTKDPDSKKAYQCVAKAFHTKQNEEGIYKVCLFHMKFLVFWSSFHTFIFMQTVIWHDSMYVKEVAFIMNWQISISWFCSSSQLYESFSVFQIIVLVLLPALLIKFTPTALISKGKKKITIAVQQSST